MPGMRNSEMFFPCYEIEGTPGTDPATTRLAWPGEFKVAQAKHAYKKVKFAQPGSRTITNRYGLAFTVGYHIEYVPFDEFTGGANSRMALAWGGAPNGSTGVVTLDDTELRSYTVQYGMDLATDVYRRGRYCKTAKWKETAQWNEPILFAEDILAIEKRAGTDTQSSAFAAQPAAYATVSTPWTHPGSASMAISVTTINGAVTGWEIDLDNHCSYVRGSQASDPIPTAVLMGGERDISGSIDLVMDDFTDFDSFATEPNATGGFFTLTRTLSKNSGGEYNVLTLPQCYFTDGEFWDYQQQNKAPWEGTRKWECAGTPTLDLKS